MNKEKLIIFMPSIEGGGVEKNFFLITNYLANKCKNIFVISISKSIKKKLNQKVNLISPNSTLFSRCGRRIKFFISLFYLYREIKKNKNCKVFCFQGIAYCAVLCKLLSTKLIIRSNSSPSGWSKNPFKIYLYKQIYSFADKIIVNSLEFKNELKKKFNLDSECIYNPLNRREVLFKSKKKINLSFFNNNDFKMINVARLADQKNQECIINAINILRNKKRIKLLIVGSGPDKDKIELLIKKFKLKSIVKIISFKDNPFPYIRKSNLLILSSKYEGLPNILLESILLKKFIISSDCPTGPKEILDNGKGGLLFPVNNYRSLAKKIELTINKKDIINRKKIAFKRLYRFDYKKRLNDYYNIIFS